MYLKRLVITALVTLALTVMAVPTALAATTASAPTSAGGVAPYIIDGVNNGGNRTCTEAGAAFGATFVYDTSKVDFPGFTATSFQWTTVIGDVPTGQYVTVVTDGTYVAFSSANIRVGAVIVKGSNDANVYSYNLPGALSDSGLASPINNSGNPAGLSNLTFCGFTGDTTNPGPQTGTLTVKKFYDANANGTFDGTDVWIDNWQVTVNGDAKLTPYSATVALGDYTVNESTALELNWMHTTATSFDVTVTAATETGVNFGNLCVGAGGGKTLGFWSNKNGAVFANTPGALAAMRDLNLRTAAGTNFDPTTYASLRTWILSATATNMANMLSAQLAATQLNVISTAVSPTSLIYAPGTASANPLGFATVAAVSAEANASLGANGLTLAGHADRATQEALKNALDRANNNLNFVQATPCTFSFPA